jgi:hypothetical protein
MFAVPTATPVTTPLELTVAIAVLLELHVIAAPDTVLLFASFAVAVATVVAPRAIDADPSDTVTDVIGTVVTVSDPCPVTPSDVATMFVVPGDTALIAPVVGLMVAMLLLLDDHAITRPASTFPAASRVTPVAFAVAPIAMGEALKDTATDATGMPTLISALPVEPWALAVIVALPDVRPVINPVVAFTEATDGALELHEKVTPEMIVLLASRATAVAVVLPPSEIVPAPNETVMLAIGG